MNRMMMVALVLAAAFALCSAVTIPKKYPLYKQCDSRWGSNEIYNQTICEVGCLMSSISMAIGGHNMQIDGKTSNPGTLNAWLRQHGGYTEHNDLIESTVVGINKEHIHWGGMVMNPADIPMDKLKSLLDTKTTVVIANVMEGRHFVLCTGYDNSQTTIYVNDPGFSRSTYQYSDVVGWRLFTMN